jgi:hypothetical protein
MVVNGVHLPLSTSSLKLNVMDEKKDKSLVTATN